MKTKSIISKTILLTICFLFLIVSAFSQQTLRTNLYIVAADGSKTLMDGNMTIYDDVYCNCVNYEDAIKFTNPGVNWGLLRSGTTLSVERRKFIQETDTSYLRMLNLQNNNYSIQIIGRNLEKANRVGYIKDNYSNTSTPFILNDTTYMNFSVNGNSNSAASNRFSVIFEKALPLLFNFTDIQTLRRGNMVDLVFAVVNEKLISHYILQQKGDGYNFKDVKIVAANNLDGVKSYTEDAGICDERENFYRVKAVGKDGEITYSPVAKILSLGMIIYPNPTTSRQFNLQLAVEKEGRYQITAISMNGAIFPLGSRQLNSMQNLLHIELPYNTKPGVYQIQLVGPENTVLVKSVSLL